MGGQMKRNIRLVPDFKEQTLKSTLEERETLGEEEEMPLEVNELEAYLEETEGLELAFSDPRLDPNDMEMRQRYYENTDSGPDPELGYDTAA